MKKLIFLFLFSILFQSCFSYRTVDYNNIASEKNQKFEVAKIDRTNVKGRLVSIDENTMILENKEGNQTILKDEIYDLKVRKFSILKTISALGSSYFFIGIGALALLLLSGFP